MKKMMKFERRKEIFYCLLMISYCIIILVPIFSIIAASFSDEKQLAIHGYGFVPRGFSLEAYRFLFQKRAEMIRAVGVTLLAGILGMIIGLTQQITLAFVLTKKDFKPKRAISLYLYFTTLFSGGQVAYYLLITQILNLDNTIWVYCLGGVGAMGVFIMRTNLQKIPYEIQESAYMDGASEYAILFKIMIPMSKPVLAYYAFGTFAKAWNDYMTPMYYITDKKLQNIQYLLQRVFMNASLLKDMPGHIANKINMPSETARMAMAVMIMIPTVITFPYFQKYMVKGMAVGSVKG